MESHGEGAAGRRPQRRARRPEALLESMGRVDIVGEASSGEEAVDKARMLEPDVVIMDLAMPGMDGVEATRRITELGIDTKVLVLTVHDEDESRSCPRTPGPRVLNKSVADTDLLGALEALARGHSYLPRRAAVCSRGRRRGPPRAANRIPRCSPLASVSQSACTRRVSRPRRWPGRWISAPRPSRATSRTPRPGSGCAHGAKSCVLRLRPGFCGLKASSKGTPPLSARRAPSRVVVTARPGR